MIKRIIFDIETGRQSKDAITRIAPEFREASVKTGNLGLDKALEKIKQARDNHIQAIQDKAALNAEYGLVIAVGLMDDQGNGDILHGDEKKILSDFWELADADSRKGGIQWVGFNSQGFDLPFLMRRSMILQVPVPEGLKPVPRYWPHFFKDLMDMWKAGDWKATISLDRFCKAAGLPGKNGDGARFQELYETDQPKALDYLMNDLAITKALSDHLLGGTK